jgi:multidrug efflux pump subunit AcrA (membrane-fusion protein)
MQAARGGSTGQPTMGEGGPTPAQLQEFRARMAQSGGGAGRGNAGSVWVMRADGKLSRVPVRILGSDMSATAVEPLRGDLKPGDKVVTKLAASQAQGNATRSLLPGPPGPPRR